MKEESLLFKNDNISLKNTINLLFLIMVFSGVFGFVYETFFYRIDLGYFVKRGSSFGPWIPIYAFGGLGITLFSYKYKKNPILVFFINCLFTGILEYLVGMFLYEVCNVRLWDYNNEILNYGNINGYICFRSVVLFGFSSLFLVYFIIPFFIKISKKISEKKLTIISRGLMLLFITDVFIYEILNIFF